MVLLNHWCIYVYNDEKIRSSRVYVHTWYILPLLKKGCWSTDQSLRQHRVRSANSVIPFLKRQYITHSSFSPCGCGCVCMCVSMT